MISKASAECFVYITLPGETSAVTAGKFVLSQNARNDAFGQFVYRGKYLDDPRAVEIDPVELKLSKRTYETVRLNGMFGALRDAGPDYWGRRVIEKHAGKAPLGELDYLLESPDDRAGALGFGLNTEPPAPKRKFNQTIDLEKLQALAEALVKDDLPNDPRAQQVQDLMLLGTSMGGARPKAVVQADGALWVAKFNRSDDSWNNTRVEYAMLRLARECGLVTAESRLETVGGKDVLLVKRFDREKTTKGYTRARMVSGLTILRADEAPEARQNWSYPVLVEEMRRIVEEPKKDAKELFRRVCFNALISNTDDHPRNHAIIAKETSWKLSPAYDLTPSTPISLERRDLALDCGDQGRYANAKNILSQHARFLLELSEAEKIVNDIRAQVEGTWYDTMRAHGVSEQDAERLRSAFVYPGFSL
ncbi:type II toxin-antitoxin system HipA family toxin [Rhodopseudomonas palustris]|uniref:Type II toxin-antitoxin system HipA family toxin n=1 Tax=Rhodopseudomonas palustris TaxID=1076 RepID=A0A418VJL2_RHOPL|nr:HipA domain-containing protein [Rhodopseudomonas palustris]RJF76308.1 type II toxin-antitoxin system HipA family toxin [Rhodopseudomonas palustris]